MLHIVIYYVDFVTYVEVNFCAIALVCMSVVFGICVLS